jgi:hypothetical protein
MKKKYLLFIVILIAFISYPCFGQQSDVVFLEPQKAQPAQVEFKSTSAGREERTSINTGVLMGGGGLIGADLLSFARFHIS